ncbi:MAG: sigma 54-interacting transcriptional regulator [Candidatus Eiseniibacteriota bacterium]
MQALATDPALRFGSADAFLETLDRHLRAHGGLPRPRGAALLTHDPWIPRPRLRAEIDGALERERVVVLTGRQGIGKSQRLDWLERTRKRAGWRVTRLPVRAGDRDLEPFRRLVGEPIPSERVGQAEDAPDGTTQGRREGAGSRAGAGAGSGAGAGAGSGAGAGAAGRAPLELVDEIDTAAARSRAEALRDRQLTALARNLAQRLGAARDGARSDVLLAIDDADRLPPGSRLLLRRLINERLLGACRIVATCQPPSDGGDLLHPADEPEVCVIVIPTLSSTEIDQALTRDFSTEGRRGELVAWLASRASGVPGRVIALLNQALAEGAISRRKGGHAVDSHRLAALPPLPASASPSTVALASIGARARRALAAVAVLGGEASAGEIESLTRCSGDGLTETLDRLLSRRCLVPVTVAGRGGVSSRKGPLPTYALAPGVDADAVLERIPAPQLRSMHAAAAECVSGLSRRLHHLRAAGHDRQAARAALEAARAARLGGDLGAAAAHYEALLDLVEALPLRDRRGAAREIAETLALCGRVARATRALRMLLELERSSERRARVAVWLAETLLTSGRDRSEVARLLDKAESLARPAGELGLQMMIDLTRGILFTYELDFGRAKELFAELEGMAIKTGSAVHQQLVQHRTGNLNFRMKRFEDACHRYRSAIEIARRSDLEYQMIRSQVALAITRERLGDNDARAALKNLIKQCKRSEFYDTAGNIVAHLSISSLRHGDFDDASIYLEEQAALATRVGDAMSMMSAAWGRALHEQLTGSLPAAIRHYRRASRLADGIGDRDRYASIEGDLAQAAIQAGDLELCRNAARRSTATSATIADPRHAMFARLAESERLRRLGRTEDSRAVLSELLDEHRSATPEPLQEAQLWCEVARRALIDGDVAASEDGVARAREAARRAGSRWVSAMIERAAADVTSTTRPELDPTDVFAPALEAVTNSGLATERWLTHVDLGRHLLERARRRDRVADYQDAIRHLERAREGLAIAGAGTEEVRGLLLDAYGELHAAGWQEGALTPVLLDRLNAVMATIGDLDGLLERVLDLVAEIVGAERGVLVLRNRRTGRLEVAAARGVPRRSQIRALTVSRTVIREVLRTGRPRVSSDAQKDEDLRDRESVRIYAIRGVTCLPLSSGGEVFGALYVDSAEHPVENPAAVDAMLKSVASYISNAVHHARVSQDQSRVGRRLRDQNLALARGGPVSADRPELVGSTAAIERLRQEIERAAVVDGPILITGEAGSGKSLVARLVHQRSSRADEPLVATVQAVIHSGPTVEDLIGPATAPAPGDTDDCSLMAQVGCGTLVIDGIVSLSRPVQKLLAGVLGGRIDRAPDRDQARTFEGRIVFAERDDPLRAVRDGRLLAELYEQAATVTIRVPPLRERRADIPSLIEHFLLLVHRESGMTAIAPPSEFVEGCVRHGFAEGNVRELCELVEQGARTSTSSDDWMTVLARWMARTAGGDAENIARPGGTFQERLREFERAELVSALRAVGWNQAAAARLLGLPPATLRYKIRSLEIEVDA